MTPELQKYYEDRFSMMATPGWGAQSLSAPSVGTQGTYYGGGGGGARNATSAISRAGGAGAQGAVIFEW